MGRLESFIQRFAPILFLLIGILVIVGAGTSYYFYSKYQSSQKLLSSPTALSTEEVNALVKKVGKLIILPSNESPTIATVSDKSKLTDSFFRNAENGDKVLIFTKAKKAILYRPTSNQIVEVGPVNVPASDVAGASTSAKLAPLTVALYNGTNTSGLTLVAEKDLKEKQPALTVVSKENASSNTYDKTLVIDITGVHGKEAATIAKDMHGQVSAMPQLEATPAAAILIILGKDYVSK